ncbi:DUF7269 family protein [Halobacterium yunchengense]|uniref:DUF7269 family protein n=1 Tax=Halobacterium yunchengense TaxID=3108497 RepID=UPI00300B694D
MLRRVLAGLGVAFVAVGVAVAVAPSVADVVRFPAVPTVFVGGLAAVLAVATYVSRRNLEFRDQAAATVRASGLEGRFEPPRPGAEVDDQLADADRDALEAQLRERLRSVAVQVLAESEGWTEAEADRRLREGTWTEDRTAAALFSDEVPPPAQDVVVSMTGLESTRERALRHALGELQRRAGLDAEGGD